MDLAIGQKTDALSLYGANIDGFDFSNCTLREADFSDANLGMGVFEGANLAEANFRGANFQHARFESATIRMADFREAEIWESDFQGTYGHDCNFADSNLRHCNFSDANLSNGQFTRAICGKGIFSAATLSGVDFTDTSLRGADFSKANAELAVFNRANLFDAIFELAETYGAIFGDAQINEGTFENIHISGVEPRSGLKVKLQRYLWGPVGEDAYRCIYDPNRHVEGVWEHEESDEIRPESQAGAVYRQFEQLATVNALPDWQRRFYILRQSVYRQRLKKDGNRIGYWFQSLQRVLFGYGESFSRIVGWSGVIILSFSFIYLVGGWIHPVESQALLGPPLSWSAALQDPRVIWDSIYYSTLTFTALGFGDYRPVGMLGQLFTIAETSLGAILLALLVYVFGRRTAR